MTPEELGTIQRDFLIRRDKQTYLLWIDSMSKAEREIKEFLGRNAPRLAAGDFAFISVFLTALDKILLDLAMRFETIVARAQLSVISRAGEALQMFFRENKPAGLLGEIKTAIFDKDAEAIKVLAGRTQSGELLSRYFLKLAPGIQNRMSAALLQGFSEGQSPAELAALTRSITGTLRHNALRIARTETNEAYRAATRTFYTQAGIKKYIWLSPLDSRVCLRCRFLHGQKFKTNKKIFSHPNCRCVLVPYLKGSKPVETGSELFEKLNAAEKLVILGPGRFSQFQNGGNLSSFIEIRTGAAAGEATTYHIKPLL